jgi:hypothetical protein
MLVAWNGRQTRGVSWRMVLSPITWLGAIALASAARAQTTPPSEPARDTVLVHRLSVDATKIQPAQFAYRLTLTRDTAITPMGDQSVAISVVDYAGTSALLLTRVGMQGVAAISDSLFVRRDDLRPLHWIASHGVARVAAEFTPDSVYGASSSPLGRRNIVLPNRADLLVNSAAVDAVLASLPLAAAWRDSAEMLLIDSGGAALTPVNLAIEGEERITVPAGDFDCWIVSLETERASARLWVTKQGQLVARSEQILPELEGATLTRVLLQTDSPALMPASARLPQ